MGHGEVMIKGVQYIVLEAVQRTSTPNRLYIPIPTAKIQ